MPIDRIAIFGDSYCADGHYFYDVEGLNEIYEAQKIGKRIGEHLPYFWPQKSWIDYLHERTGLPIDGRGLSGLGPDIAFDSFYDYVTNNDIANTYIIFCWSDIGRKVHRAPLSEQSKLEHKFITPFLKDSEYVTEIGSPGPDSPMLEELSKLSEEDAGWANAIKLWWLYLDDPVDHERRWRTIKLAFKQLLLEYNITNIQEYYCFKHTAQMEKESKPLDFVYNGKVFTNLYEFAQSIPDYGTQGIDDLNYPNHMSPQGQLVFTELLMQRMAHVL